MLLFYSLFPWKKGYGLLWRIYNHEEFIITNKMFVQIFVLLNNLMCYVVVFYVQEFILYKLNFSKNKDTDSLIMCKMLSQKFQQNFINIIIHTILTIMHTKSLLFNPLYLAHQSQWSFSTTKCQQSSLFFVEKACHHSGLPKFPVFISEK